MSRGKNAVRRGNKTLAWYISDKVLDKNDNERDSPSPVVRAQSANDRKNSLESQSSIASAKTGVAKLDCVEEKRRRDRKGGGRRGNRKQSNVSVAALLMLQQDDEPNPARDANADDKNAAKERKEDYWYYDPVSDGFYYEQNGSRGWRKRNPKIHGPPMAVKSEAPEQKVAPAPIPPVQTSKFFPNAAAANLPNIKYYDAATDGYFYEMASVDGWKRRQPVAPSSAPTSNPFAQQTTKAERWPQSHFVQNFLQQAKPSNSLPGSFVSSAADRILTNAEVEEIIVSETPPSGVIGMEKAALSASSGHANSLNAMVFSSMLGMQQQRSRLGTFIDECPSSSVSSSMSDDHGTPPPQPTCGIPTQRPALPGQNNAFDGEHISTQLTVGSFEEPYEFYWSDTEKSEKTVEKASSVSSVEDSATGDQDLSAYFEELRVHNRPTSLRLPSSMPLNAMAFAQENAYVPGFDVDQFIADLPPVVDHDKILRNLSALKTPMGDPRTVYESLSDSPLFTPIQQRENVWERAPPMKTGAVAQQSSYDSAAAALQGRLKDIEKIWHCPAF